jgi:hypothetical protein
MEMLADERKQVRAAGPGQDENSCQAVPERPRLPDVRAGGSLSCNASVGSILASDDRLGLDKPESLVKAPRGIVGGLCRLRVLRTNADDRLPGASLGRVEGGDSSVEGRDVADVRPQSSVPHPLDDLAQLGTI